ncbi:MAG: HEPN domain-containing protein [Promethearchaeota archaeon]
MKNSRVVEKSLKALFLYKKQESEKIRSIIYLANALGVPDNLISGIRDLNPEYVKLCYPDISGCEPADLYDNTIAGRHLKTARDVLS